MQEVQKHRLHAACRFSHHAPPGSNDGWQDLELMDTDFSYTLHTVPPCSVLMLQKDSSRNTLENKHWPSRSVCSKCSWPSLSFPYWNLFHQGLFTEDKERENNFFKALLRNLENETCCFHLSSQTPKSSSFYSRTPRLLLVDLAFWSSLCHFSSCYQPCHPANKDLNLLGIDVVLGIGTFYPLSLMDSWNFKYLSAVKPHKDLFQKESCCSIT